MLTTGSTSVKTVQFKWRSLKVRCFSLKVTGMTFENLLHVLFLQKKQAGDKVSILRVSHALFNARYGFLLVIRRKARLVEKRKSFQTVSQGEKGAAECLSNWNELEITRENKKTRIKEWDDRPLVARKASWFLSLHSVSTMNSIFSFAVYVGKVFKNVEWLLLFSFQNIWYCQDIRYIDRIFNQENALLPHKQTFIQISF